MKLKYCGGCGKSKLMREFSSHADTYDGKQSRCRECQSIRGKIYHMKRKELACLK